MDSPRSVAALVTVYRRHSHADVIVGKVLEGYRYDDGERPDLRLSSLYVDQFPADDLSRELARKYSFRQAPTAADALTLGTGRLAVDGVLIVGEHGDYPKNSRGQTLYPRRRLFAEAAKVFEKSGRSVPVFLDKHLSAEWVDAKWVYDRSRELHCPLLAGSTIPLTWRRPPLQLPKGAKLTEAVQIGYGPLEGYGFHALEGLQCQAERRAGGETGVKAVRCLQGPAIWQALDRGDWSRELLEAGLKLVPAHAPGGYRGPTAKAGDAAVFLVEYRDGFRAAVAMLNGYLYEGDGGAFVFAGRVDGRPQPVACQYYLQQPDPFAHFGYLVRAIDRMVHTGHAGYPVERTLLTTGMLDAAMMSRAEGQRRVETPHLAIRYQPTDWPFATDPVPKPIKR